MDYQIYTSSAESTTAADSTRSNLTHPERLCQLARRTKFQQRNRGKITPEIFVDSICEAAFKQAVSFRQLAVVCGSQADDTIAKQSVWERVNSRAEAVVLDLRANSGGNLREVNKLTGLFLGEKVIAQSRRRGQEIQSLSAIGEKPVWTGILVVLTNRYSAAGAEILSSALQDYGRAVHVGDYQTFGNGTAAHVLPVAADESDKYGYLRVVTDCNFRITGSSNQVTGVTPNIILPSPRDELEVGSAFFSRPVPHETIKPIEFEPWNENPIPLGKLRAQSLARIVQSVEFRHIGQENEAIRARGKENRLLLDYGERVASKIDSKKEKEARVEELNAYYDQIREEYEKNVRAWNLTMSRIDDKKLQPLSEASKEDLSGVRAANSNDDSPAPPMGFDATKREAIAIALDLIELEAEAE